MAELIAVIGILANIIGIIDGIDKARPLWKKYFHKSSSLRTELLPVLGKLNAFAGILRGLQLQCELDEADVDRLRTLHHIEDPLKASEQAVRLISDRLDQTVTIAGASFSFGKVLNKETAAALQILDEAKPVLDLALAADQRTLVKSIETYVRNVAEHVRDARLESKLYHEELKGHLHALDSRETERVQAQAKADVMSWISQVNYSSNYHAALRPSQQVHPSGEWFIDGESFRRWKDGSGPQLLLTGISGSGKTVLCAKAIDHIARLKASNASQPLVLYFFFDFNDAAKESVQGMIRALLHQLVADFEQIPAVIQSFHTRHSSATSTLPSTQDWIDLLCSFFNGSRNIFVFIDALDECAEAEQAEFQSVLRQLCASTYQNVHWLLTCRPNNRMTSELDSQLFRQVEMEAEQVSRDIESFLSTAMEADPRLSSYSKDASKRIVTEIKSRSEGMFRYARCQLDSIAKLRDRRIKKVEDALRIMPRDLHASYVEIIREAQSLDDWPIIARILVLASFSARPVTVAEAAEFAVMEDGMVSLEPDDRLDITDVLSTIDVLVTVRDGILTMAHKSVQEFFEEIPESSLLSQFYRDGEYLIASRCLQYLRFAQTPVVDLPEARGTKEPNTSQLNKLLRDYPFLDYAATRWPHHLREKTSQVTAVGLMAGTLPLTCKPNLWKAWLLLQRADIWANQIQLARLLCEFFVRGSLVTGWSSNFWKQRQAYRVWSDTASQAISKSVKELESNVSASSHGASVSYFWTKAIRDRPGEPEFPYLQFRKGDLIFVHSTHPSQPWTVSKDGSTGVAMPNHLERCAPHLDARIAGLLFHDLAVLLIEVALQSSLPTEVTKMLQIASSEADLAHYLSRLKRLTSRVTDLMGKEYGEVVRECLGKVHWLGKTARTEFVDLQDSQELAMHKLCEPLERMLTSGFQASRGLVKRSIRLNRGGNIEHYRYSSNLATNHTGSAPPRAVGYSNTTGPYYPIPAQYSASTNASPYHTASYSNTIGPYYPSPAPYSASTNTSPYHTASHSNNIGPYYPGPAPYSASTNATRYHTTSAVDHFSYQLPHHSAPQTFTYGRATNSEPMYFQSESIAFHTTNSSTVASKSDNLPNSSSAAIMSAPQSSPPVVLDSVMETIDEAQSEESSGLAKLLESIDSVFETHIISTPYALEPAGTDGVSTDQRPNSLRWKVPDQLMYSICNENFVPKTITQSDHQREEWLQATHETVRSSGDNTLRLHWVRNVLEHLYTSEVNLDRARRALSTRAYKTDDQRKLRTSAVEILESLAEQRDPEAIFIRAKWAECDRFDFVTDKAKLIEDYTFAATNGHARAWYRLGLQHDRSNEAVESFESFRRGVEAKDAACLYRWAMRVIKGGIRRQSEFLRGMEILDEAAAAADEDAPKAPYTLGLIYAHRFSDVRIPAGFVNLDWEKAVSNLERAAVLGCAKAQLELGFAYEFGDLGLEQNYSLSLHYYVLAANRGEPEAELKICRFMLNMQGKDELVDSIGHAYAKRAALDRFPGADEALEWYDRPRKTDLGSVAQAPNDFMVAKTEVTAVPSDLHEGRPVETTRKETSYAVVSESLPHDVAIKPKAEAIEAPNVLKELGTKPDIRRTSRLSRWSNLNPVLASLKKQGKSGDKKMP